MIGGQVREILLRKAFRRIVIRLACQICDGRSKLLCKDFKCFVRDGTIPGLSIRNIAA